MTRLQRLRIWAMDHEEAVTVAVICGLAIGPAAGVILGSKWVAVVVSAAYWMAIPRAAIWLRPDPYPEWRWVEIEGREDPEAEQVLMDVLEELPGDTKELLSRSCVKVRCVHDEFQARANGNQLQTINGSFVYGPAGNFINIYTCPMRQQQSDPVKFRDWMRRLVLHEIGHVDGLTDQQMAERYGY